MQNMKIRKHSCTKNKITQIEEKSANCIKKVSTLLLKYSTVGISLIPHFVFIGFYSFLSKNN